MSKIWKTNKNCCIYGCKIIDNNKNAFSLYLAMFIYILTLVKHHRHCLLISPSCCQSLKPSQQCTHNFLFTLQRITILIQILSADFMFSFVSWLHVQLYLPLFCVWFQGYPLVVCLPGGYSRGGVCHSRSRNRSRWRCLCYNYKEIIVLLVNEWTCAIVIYWTLGTLKTIEYVNILCMYMRILPTEFFFFPNLLVII